MKRHTQVPPGARRHVFNAKYYADLKAAFGCNEEALYKHYLTYELKGRALP